MRGTPSPKRIRRTFLRHEPTRRTSFYAADGARHALQRRARSSAPSSVLRIRTGLGQVVVQQVFLHNPTASLWVGSPRLPYAGITVVWPGHDDPTLIHGVVRP